MLQRAHALAAATWGADLCRFATGGSTQSLHTALAALARPGDTVVFAQNAHKAEFPAAVLAGLDVQVIPVEVDREWDLEHGVSPATLAATLDRHPSAKAVVVVSPSYYGVTSDIRALARACHARGVPLIVDAAWGAAYGFNPRLPASAVASGADIVVVSIHKTMAALGQGSAMLVSGGLVDQERFALAYELFETTSPSVPILASLDATRREHALHGKRLWSRVVDLALETRARLAKIEGVRVFGRGDLGGEGAYDLDVTKITLDVGALGISGFEADDWLIRRRRVNVGVGDARHVLIVLSLGTTARDVDRMCRAIAALSKHARSRSKSARRPPALPQSGELVFEMAMPASEAFHAQAELVAYEDASGRIAAEIIAPAPPGVPRLIPGQRITAGHVAYLVANRAAGAFILDPADPTDRKLRVVKR